VSPTKVGPGALVTIAGQNFNARAGNNFIRIGSNPMTVATSSTSQLTFTLPSGIAAGNYELWVRVGTDSARAASPFEVIAPGNFVSTDKIPINEAIVNNCFYGVGLQNVHPRLFFSEVDIDRIKTMAQTDAFAKSTYDNIINKANAILPTALLDYGLDGANLRIPNIHKFSNEQAPFLVLAYLFTKDTRYALRCWRRDCLVD
jgi:hypothetical protein